jgi:serine/threonine protein kinase
MMNGKFGQSGSSLLLLQGDGEKKVPQIRKTSDNPRFRHQFKKHETALKTSSMYPLLVPEIRQSFKNDSYTMDYVYSENLGEYLVKKETNLVRGVILQYLNRIIELEDFLTEKQKIALIEYLKSKIKENHDLGYVENAILKIYGSKYSELIMDSKIPKGWNHGDFSFENILISRESEEVYVIDFLDSPVETPLIDLGRLYLDLSLGWWNSSNRINEFSDQVLLLKASTESIVTENKIDLKVLNLFSFLAALRVMPYTKNPIRLGYLKSYFHDKMDL